MSDWKASDWYLRAKDMPVGTRLRMPHRGCSIGDTLQVTVKREGILAYCHLCHEAMFVAAGALSMAEKASVIASREAADKSLARSHAFPLPKTENPSEWPLDARVWLYKSGVGNYEIEHDGIYYHSPSNRVVIPIRDNGVLTGYYQARSVVGRPKYLNPSGFNRDTIIQTFGGTGRAVILCEDYLSARRVHSASSLPTIGLLGTNLSTPIAARLVATGCNVGVWLDNDKAGRTASREIFQKLSLFGIEAREIHASADPKTFNDDEIREILHVAGF